MALALSALLLLWPVAMNRDAFMFGDTVNYLTAGRKVWTVASHAVHRSTAGPAVSLDPPRPEPARSMIALGGRSPFYGAIAWTVFESGGAVAVAALQSVWVAAALLLAFGRLGLGSLRRRVAAVALLSAATTVGFFTSTVMPDVFTGLAVIAIGLLWFTGTAMSRIERGFWFGTLLAATLFHVSILLMGIVITAGLWLATRSRWPRREALAIVLIFSVAAVGTAAVDIVAAKVTRTRVVAPPLLLARLIGDGTAGRVLAADCPTRHYETCRYLPALPLRENDFLWQSPKAVSWNNSPDASRIVIVAEQKAIIRAVLTRYPLTQLGRSLDNAATQLWTTGLDEFEMNPAIDLGMRSPEFAEPIARYHASAVVRDRLSLAPLATAWAMVYALAAALSLALLLGWRRLGLRPATVGVVVTVFAGIVVNAAINGALSGVFGRYGARVEWLALFGLIALIASRRGIGQADARPVTLVTTGLRGTR